MPPTLGYTAARRQPGRALANSLHPGGVVSETARALLVAMDQWADQGIQPPASNYPRLENRTLVPRQVAETEFPAIPGVMYPIDQNQLQLLDFGPEFGKLGGVLTIQPPLAGSFYQQFVPRPDRDGLDVAGVRPLQIRVPLGTSTGWNTRRLGHRAPDLCGLTGSYFPLPSTRAARLASGDPRRSLEERYHTHAGFVREVERETRHLVHERFLLPLDADAFVAAAQASNILQ